MHNNLANNVAAAKLRQQSYPPMSFLSSLDYVVEETVEIKKEFTFGSKRYKYFKESKPIDHEAMLSELADLYICTMNVLAVSGYYPQEIENAVTKKLSANLKRTDHIRN